MIGVLFYRGGEEVVEVRINGNDLQWRSTIYGASYFPIDTIDLPREKVMKEFPELADVKNWRDRALEKFKNHFKSIEGERNKVNYIVQELSKVGYMPHSYQKQGGRVTKWTGQV